VLPCWLQLSLSSELLSALAEPERWTDFKERLEEMQVRQTQAHQQSV
jgi:hypothetical protein